MENRYGTQLRDSIKEIRALVPASETLGFVMAFEFQKLYRKGDKVLEIGCGKGDSARLLLHYTQAKLDLLDISPQMILSCKKNLSEYKKRIHYICADALLYLRKSEPYNIILSSWTIHNFSKKEQKDLLMAMYAKLTTGGSVMFMEKVYPNKSAVKLLDEQQFKRYKYLSPDICREVTTHDKNDTSDKFRMDERPLMKMLKDVGFHRVSIVDRVERDIVVIARK